jgi:hypothetical protein
LLVFVGGTCTLAAFFFERVARNDLLAGAAEFVVAARAFIGGTLGLIDYVAKRRNRL